jgi:hypothetical protein
MKNPWGKSIPVEPRATLADRAYAVYEDLRLPGWTWYVLKVNQAPGSKKGKFSSAFCLVTSPMTGGSGDLGDTYLSDIGGTLIKGVDIKAGAPIVEDPLADILDKPIPGKQYALTSFKNGGPSIANGNTWAESEVKED